MTQSVLFTAAFPASAFFPGHKHFSSTISIQTKSKDNQGGPLLQAPQMLDADLTISLMSLSSLLMTIFITKRYAP